ARLALAVIEVDRHDELLARQRLALGECRAAAVGERVASLPARAAPADAVGVGEGEQHAGAQLRCRTRTLGAQRPLQIARRAARALEDGAVGAAAAALPAQQLEARADVGIAR